MEALTTIAAVWGIIFTMNSAISALLQTLWIRDQKKILNKIDKTLDSILVYVQIGVGDDIRKSNSDPSSVCMGDVTNATNNLETLIGYDEVTSWCFKCHRPKDICACLNVCVPHVDYADESGTPPCDCDQCSPSVCGQQDELVKPHMTDETVCEMCEQTVKDCECFDGSEDLPLNDSEA